MSKGLYVPSSGDWLRASRLNRRQLLRRGVIATGAVAVLGGLSVPSALAQGGGTVSGYFGTFNDLSGKKEGWPSLEHDEVNDSLWKLIMDTGKADNTNMQFANVDAGSDQSKQVQNAINYITQGYSAIYINTGTPAGWDQVVQQANAADVLTMNHSPDALTGATQNVVIDHAQAGDLNAQAAAKWAQANGVAPVAATLAILNSVPLKLRTDTFKASLKKLAPDTMLYEDVAVPLNNPNASAAAAQNLLNAHPDINILFCYNDDTAAAVSTALAQQGISDPTQFWIGGVDGTNSALQNISSGTSTEQATAAFLFGYSAAALQSDVEKILSGQKVPPTRALLPQLATIDNVQTIQAQSNGALDPQYRSLYDTMIHYFDTPLVTGGPLPSVITGTGG
jgi:ABC-type sugar transport system substrate-binding protein